MPYIDFAYRLSRGWTSWWIGYWGGGYWSHVDIIDPQGQWWGARSDAVGGQPPGFWPRPATYETDVKDLLILRLSVTPVQLSSFWDAAESIKGDPYNTSGILGFALDNGLSQEGAYFCSQASAMLKVTSHMMGPLHQRLSKVTPGDDAIIVAALGGQEIPSKGYPWKPSQPAAGGARH